MKMRKIPVLLFTLLLVPFLLPAQKTSPVKLGLRIAPGIGWINPGTTGYESDGIRGVISAGLVTDFYFTDNYAISTGFSFLFPSGKMSYEDVLLKDDTQDTGRFANTYKFIYFEIPLMVKMQTNQFGKFSFFGQIGFGTAFCMKATAEAEFTSTDGNVESSKLDINNKTALMRESILAGIGIEYHIDKSTRLAVGVNYSNALNNVFNSINLLTNQEVKGFPNFVELNIGVLF
jgi:hypothetical protein